MLLALLISLTIHLVVVSTRWRLWRSQWLCFFAAIRLQQGYLGEFSEGY